MERKVKTIPATLNRFTEAPVLSRTKRKVAGYARVSTDHDEQLTSYEAQLDYYTNYIKAHDDWEFAGMYSDEGISGTNTKHRVGFQKMIADAKAGKIDLIITKSVSRFARNTVDSLTTVRDLKALGIEIYFEKENIWTLDSKGELLITIMSSLAQEESRSISENVAWGKRKSMSDGKVYVSYKTFLGYDKGMVVNREQAEVVRLIYKLYLMGYSEKAICKKLMEKGYKAPAGGDKWHQFTVQSILQNEKYKGDALLQKTYTEDFLTKKHKKNNGELPQYYVEDHHEAIIPPDVFEKAQAERARRKQNKYSGISIFSSRIKCGNCGEWFGSRVWHSNDKYRRTIWQCRVKYRHKGESCHTPHLTEDEIKEAFMKAFAQYYIRKDEILENTGIVIYVACDVTELRKKQAESSNEMQVVNGLAGKLIEDNARRARDQDEFQQEYNELVERYNKAKEAFEEATEQIKEKQNRRIVLEGIVNELSKMPGMPVEFSDELFTEFIDYMTVYEQKRIVVTFRDGTEIEVK